MLIINPVNPQPRLIQMAVDVLRKGGVICYPTDTVYGIGCDIFNQKAVKRIHQIKSRPQGKPFSFMCADFKDVNTYAYISNFAYRIMKKKLPGPYTFVLQATKIVPKIMLSKQKTVGIRVSENAICQMIIETLGNPIITTSAVTAEDGEHFSEAFEIEECLGRQLDLIIDGGPVPPQPSSVISLIEDQPEILRAGKGDVSEFV